MLDHLIWDGLSAMMLRTLFLCLTTAGLSLLGACSHTPFFSSQLRVDDDHQCPLNLRVGQELVLNLPSNPSTGFRWKVRAAAPTLLTPLGPEAYLPPEGNAVGGEGISRWHFRASHTGNGRLLLSYQRPWEATSESAGLFDCRVNVVD